MLATVIRMGIVVIVVKVLLANVLDLVLENHVKMISNAEQMNIVVVLLKHVPSIVLEKFVPRIVTVHFMNLVVVVVQVANVRDLVLGNHVK
jgi:hypothetical protein